jgi:hypothetical protein
MDGNDCFGACSQENAFESNNISDFVLRISARRFGRQQLHQYHRSRNSDDSQIAGSATEAISNFFKNKKLRLISLRCILTPISQSRPISAACSI